jgi:succinylarginine dihydrolase
VKSASNPRQAALQGLAKMRELAARGFAQAVLPPQARPNFRLLRRLGFSGTDADVLAQAWREAPVILACAYSAAPMWTANAATVSPSADTADGRVHFTAANLNNKLHRAEEHVQATRTLRALFAEPATVRRARPAALDPGLRRRRRGEPHALRQRPRRRRRRVLRLRPVEFDPSAPARKNTRRARPWKPRRPSPACTAWTPARTVFAAQNPDVIDQGVFHNDVIAVGNGNVLFYHEQAFADEAATLDAAAPRAGGVGAELRRCASTAAWCRWPTRWPATCSTASC